MAEVVPGADRRRYLVEVDNSLEVVEVHFDSDAVRYRMPMETLAALGAAFDLARTRKSLSSSALEKAGFEAVDHPDHYNSNPSDIECIDVVEHMGFNVGNAIKYLWRADHKGDAEQDLAKAKWYIERELERRSRL